MKTKLDKILITEPNELRIGNYVIRDGAVHKITAYDFPHWDANEYEPIHITSKDLFEFGFYDIADNINGYKKNIVFEHNQMLSGKKTIFQINALSKMGGVLRVCDVPIKCDYIHQLQNAWFVVWRKEIRYESNISNI